MHAKDHERGLDTSFAQVDLATKPNYIRIKEILRISRSVDSVFSVKVAKKTFLLHREFTRAHRCPLGRGTRCFIAYDEELDRAVLLKDTWRKEASAEEGKVYEDLKKSGVPNLFNVLAYEDVEDVDERCNSQRVIFKYKDQSGQEKEKVLCHCRLVLDRVGRSLNEFETERELVVALRDALIAHKVAFENAGLLHRDISAGNIILNTKDAEERGFLIDWELAKVQTSADTRLNERAGTYRFLSIRLLEDIGNTIAVKHELQDDLESFFYVLYWMAARHAPNAMTDTQKRAIFNCFDDPDPKMAAELKRKLIRARDAEEDLRLRCRPLTTLLVALMDALSCSLGLGRFKFWIDPYERSERSDPSPYGNLKYTADMQSHDLMLRLFNDALEKEEWT
ncbi:hypothetical protein BT69DRAFT_1258121 [Atractiella rhizophila]|nr:hypothetical protein BT69DRAFT_1258121 [Atractiella rhizophila]